MPVETALYSLKVYNQHKNGENFASNTSDFNTDFAAIIGEKVRVDTQVNVTWWAEARYADEWEVQAGSIIRTTGDFENDGFAVGQSFQFYAAANWPIRFTAASEFTATIDTIQQGGKYLTFTVTVGAQVTTGSNLVDVGIWADLTATPTDAPDAVFFKWNLLPNGDNFSNISPQTDEAQTYYASSLTASDTAMSPEGSLQGWVSGSATAQKESTSYEKNTQTYLLKNSFVVLPYWGVSWLAYLQGSGKPPLYQQNTSLAYVFQAEFRHGLTTTTGAKTANVDGLIGLTGWFGESFGGITSDYSSGAATYTDTASAAAKTGIQKYTKTTAAFTISKVSGSFSAGQKVGVYISYLPQSETEYQQTTTQFADNFLYDVAFHTEGAGATIGSGIIKRCEATLNAGDLDIEIDTEYTSAEQLRLSAGDSYAIWVIVEDSALSAPNSDRAAVMVHANDYDVTANVPDLASWLQMNIFPHQFDYGIDPGVSTAMNLWNEDGILVDWSFSIDTDKNVTVDAITFKLYAYNSSTGESFDLDSHSYNLGSVITSGGIQQINIDTTRGYVLKSGDQFNFIKSSVGGFSSPTQIYSGAFAQKIKWQEWVQNLDVDTVFYDSAEENDNLNFKSDNYSGLNGYDIHMVGIVTCTGDDVNGTQGIGVETLRSSALTILDYGQSDSTWTGTIYTLDPDTLADLGGEILGNKNTLFRVVWTETADISSVYAIHRIESAGSASDNIKELSSLRLPPTSGNILIPKDGETLTTLTVVGSDIHSECLIDYTQLDPNKQYNISARIERYTAAANFITSFPGCVTRVTNTYSGGGTITNIQYQFYLGITLVDTQNTLLTAFDWEAGSLYANESIRIVQTLTLSVGGPVATEATVLFPAFAGCRIVFQSNTDTGDTFDPLVTDSTAESYWRMPDDIVRTGNSFSLLGSAAGFDGTTQNVYYRCDDYGLLTNYDIRSDKIVGTIDFSLGTDITTFYLQSNSGHTGITFPTATQDIIAVDCSNNNIIGVVNLSPLGAFLAGVIKFSNNPNIVGVTNPISSKTITQYRFDSCGLTGTLSIASLTGLKELLVNQNSGLTSITNPTSSAVWTSYWAWSCGLTGSLNVSTLTGLAGDFQVQLNTGLTSIANPTSSQVFTNYWAYGCNLTGTLDLSGLSGLGGFIYLYSNPNLTGVTNPSSTQAISRYRIYSCGLTGTFDISGLTGMAELLAYANSGLTAITNGTHSTNWTSYWVYNCNLTGTLNTSGLSGWGGDIRLYGNSNLTGLSAPTSSQAISIFWGQDCDFTGTLNISTLTGLGGSFDLHNNPNLTGVTNPTSSQTFSLYTVEGCGLTGTLSVSGLTGLAGTFDCDNNTSLTGLTLPASSGTITNFRASNCDLAYFDITGMTFSAGIVFDCSDNNMTAAEVNHILVDLDANLPGTGTGTITINGTNAAPDGTSGGYDGTTAVSNLVASGYTVITS